MDKVTILSRLKFLNYEPKEESVAIRISDRKPVKDSKDKLYLDTLRLSFYDIADYAENIDRNSFEGSNRLILNDKLIIDEFIDKYKDKKFVLHCEQGVSRSAAVGYYILKKLGFENELLEKKESCLYNPNIEVYGVLIGTPYTKETSSYLRKQIDAFSNY